MHPRKPLMLACVIAAGSASAHADIFTWLSGTGLWENPGLWNGTPGQYPDSIIDSATISGAQSRATLNQNLAVGTLNVLNGASVNNAGNSIFVNADTIITGIGSSISVSETASLRDFDTDTLNITAGILALYGGLAQFDEALIINGSGGVIGSGTIEMNSTTGNIDLDGGGALWAIGGSGPSNLFKVTRTDSSTSKLDWTDPSAGIIVWDNKTFINEIPYSGALGGEISLSSHEGDVSFESAHAIVGAPNSEIHFYGAFPFDDARVSAPVIDSYGLIDVSTRSQLDAPFTALRGFIGMDEGTTLSINAGLLIFDSINVVSHGDNSEIRLGSGIDGVVNFIGGDSIITMTGAGSKFDLDGSLDKTVNIADDSSLWLEVEAIDTANVSRFDGTLNIDGSLHVQSVNGAITWNSAGDINLDTGEITGRSLVNDGVIRGTGNIDAAVVNNGEIIADGGTLQFGSVSMDGSNDPQTGILRAQTGDLIMNMQANGGLRYFTGSAFVGSGSGIREVLQADVNLVIREENGTTGSIHLNSGFLVVHDFSQRGDLIVDGVSQIRVTGTEGADRIGFGSNGTNTINGTLEVDGETWFVPDTTFNGSGKINAVSSVKGTHFQDGADLSNISFISSGPIFLTDVFQCVAGVNELTMGNTASLNASMYFSDFQDQVVADKLNVQGNATLDGELVLTLYPETDLPVGETVTILQADSITGDFDEVDDSGLGINRRAVVTVTDSTVEVLVVCAADLNADGQLNFFDISEFLALYNSQDPEADLTEDGLFNFFDVSMFLSIYNQGC